MQDADQNVHVTSQIYVNLQIPNLPNHRSID